jgi:hypothetical protein
VAGIEPASSAWKAGVLPLNYTRRILTLQYLTSLNWPNKILVEGGGFEPPKLTRQIYSLIPLATREPLRKAAHCPDRPPPCQPFPSIKLSTYMSFVMRRRNRPHKRPQCDSIWRPARYLGSLLFATSLCVIPSLYSPQRSVFLPPGTLHRALWAA